MRNLLVNKLNISMPKKNLSAARLVQVMFTTSGTMSYHIIWFICIVHATEMFHARPQTWFKIWLEIDTHLAQYAGQ